MMKFETLSNCQSGYVMQSGFSSFIVAYITNRHLIISGLLLLV